MKDLFKYIKENKKGEVFFTTVLTICISANILGGFYSTKAALVIALLLLIVIVKTIDTFLSDMFYEQHKKFMEGL